MSKGEVKAELKLYRGIRTGVLQFTQPFTCEQKTMNDIQERLGDVLDREMHRMQISQEQLGERMGVTQQAISGWKRSGHIPQGRMEQIKEIFGSDSPLMTNAERWAREKQEINRSLNAGRTPSKQPPMHPRQTILFGSQRTPSNKSSPAEAPLRALARFHESRKLESEFAEALPEEYRQFLDRRVPVGAGFRRLDYISDAVAMELVIVREVQMAALNRVHMSLVRLAVVRAATQATHSDRKYVVLLCNASGTDLPFTLSERIATDCLFMGIVLVTSTDMPELASKLLSLESEPAEHSMSDIDFDDPDSF